MADQHKAESVHTGLLSRGHNHPYDFAKIHAISPANR